MLQDLKYTAYICLVLSKSIEIGKAVFIFSNAVLNIIFKKLTINKFKFISKKIEI